MIHQFHEFFKSHFWRFLAIWPNCAPSRCSVFFSSSCLAVNFAEQPFFSYLEVNLEEDWVWLRGGLIQLKYITGHRTVVSPYSASQKGWCVSSGCKRQTEMKEFIATAHTTLMENTVNRDASSGPGGWGGFNYLQNVGVRRENRFCIVHLLSWTVEVFIFFTFANFVSTEKDQ